MSYDTMMLNKHEREMNKQDAYQEYLESKTEHVMRDLLSGSPIWFNGTQYDIADFISEVEIPNDTMIEVLIGGSSGLQELFSDYCEKLAVIIIDTNE